MSSFLLSKHVRLMTGSYGRRILTFKKLPNNFPAAVQLHVPTSSAES